MFALNHRGLQETPAKADKKQFEKGSFRREIPSLRDEPIAQPRNPVIELSDTIPVYSNTGDISEVNMDPLNSSLCTVSSQPSINLPEQFSARHEAYKNHSDDELSFGASEVDFASIHAIVDPASCVEEPTVVKEDPPVDDHVSIPETVAGSNRFNITSPLRITPAVCEPSVHTEGRFVWKQMLLFIVVFCLGLSANWMQIIPDDRASQESTFADQMDPRRPITDSFVSMKNCRGPNEVVLSEDYAAAHTVLSALSLLVLVRFALYKSTGQNKEEQWKPLRPKHLPATPYQDKILAGFDLSEYESLSTIKLRLFLRLKGCNYEGKKWKLIRRLAYVYASELETLTVTQLRRKAKSVGVKQAGKKDELIQMIVEAGF